MARMVLFVTLLILICCAPSLDARKLLNMENEDGLIHGVILGDITTTYTSRRTQRPVDCLHLARVDRILESVPSPGVGH